MYDYRNATARPLRKLPAPGGVIYEFADQESAEAFVRLHEMFWGESLLTNHYYAGNPRILEHAGIIGIDPF
jgi:hypothetical protein